MTRFRTRIATLLIGLAANVLAAQDKAAKPAHTGIEGIWEGELPVGETKLRLVITITRKDDGLAATLDSPSQGAKGIPVAEVAFKDKALRLDVSKIRALFEGKANAGLTEITGDWKQGGGSLPLTLKRVDKASEVKRPQEPKRPFPYAEQEVVYENKKAGVKLAGTLTLPKGKGPSPAVLLITGSGAQDRNEEIFGHKPFLLLADYLTRRGIAVLRVDDRGVGGSTGSTPQSTTADFTEDVLTGVDFLKGRQEINPRQIGLLGHSEGGSIAALAAARTTDVAFIILLAGSGLPGDELLYLQGALIAKASGADDKQLARQRAIQEKVFALLKEEKDNAAAEQKVRAFLKEEVERLPEEERKIAAATEAFIAAQIKASLTPWFRYFVALDPRPALRHVHCPVLALNGSKDLQVAPRENLEAIVKALKEAGNTDVTTREMAGLNHLFQTCKTGKVSEYGGIEETMAPQVLEVIGDWIARHTKP
jgi:pimeloyl-ACP methyl ester carboxylesterase